MWSLFWWVEASSIWWQAISNLKTGINGATAEYSEGKNISTKKTKISKLQQKVNDFIVCTGFPTFLKMNRKLLFDAVEAKQELLFICEILCNQPWTLLKIWFPQKCLLTSNLLKSCVKGSSNVNDYFTSVLWRSQEFWFKGETTTGNLNFSCVYKKLTDEQTQMKNVERKFRNFLVWLKIL